MRVKTKHVVVTGLVLLALYSLNFLYASQNGGEGGTFGDSFGAVNALFSGSALFFLVLAFLSQREELELVRQERDDTREILSSQQDLNEQQARYLETQLFHQSFNSLYQQALAERQRLLVSGFEAGQTQSSHLGAAGRSAEVLLSRGISAVEANPILREQVFNVSVLISLVIHCAALIDNSQVNNEKKPALRQLLVSMLDTSLATCIAYTIVDARMRFSGMPMYEQFFENYELRKVISDKAVESFDLFVENEKV